MDWFLYDIGLRHERVKGLLPQILLGPFLNWILCPKCFYGFDITDSVEKGVVFICLLNKVQWGKKWSIFSTWLPHVHRGLRESEKQSLNLSQREVSRYGVCSGPYFLTFELNTERYSVSLHIQSKCGKRRTRKNSVFRANSYLYVQSQQYKH